METVSATKGGGNAGGRKWPSETSLTRRFRTVRLDSLAAAFINNTIYKRVDPNDPATKRLVGRMRRFGWLGAMAVTTDNVIVSGHRRQVAARLAGIKKVSVEVLPITSTDPHFAEYLTAYNEQRKKTPLEEIREEIAATDPADAYAKLLDYRRDERNRMVDRVDDAGLCILDPDEAKERAEISAVKRPMLDAAVGIIERYRSYWPLTLRQVHYRMLPLRVLRNAKKPKSTYVNDRASYQDLSKLLVRARLTGVVSFDAIEDETRPVTNWKVWDSTGPFVRKNLDTFLTGYRRNLQQSQPAHVLLFVEKMTVQTIAERAAQKYHVPVCVGRGYPSITSVHEMYSQFRRSGKNKMILLIASDFDPEGENIANSLTALLRDECCIIGLTAVKVALTREQVEDMNLPPDLEVKDSSSRAAGFVAEHGRAVYELEAIEPAALERIFDEAIASVLDLEMFNHECRREADDARELEARRRHMLKALGEVEG